MQKLEFVDVGIRQQVAPQGEHLSELEKGQSQFLEGFPHLRRLRPVVLAAHDAQELVPGQYPQYLQ